MLSYIYVTRKEDIYHLLTIKRSTYQQKKILKRGSMNQDFISFLWLAIICNYLLFGFLISLKHCTLDTRGVRILCVTLLCTLDYALLCWQYCCTLLLFSTYLHALQ